MQNALSGFPFLSRKTNVLVCTAFSRQLFSSSSGPFVSLRFLVPSVLLCLKKSFRTLGARFLHPSGLSLSRFHVFVEFINQSSYAMSTSIVLLYIGAIFGFLSSRLLSGTEAPLASNRRELLLSEVALLLYSLSNFISDLSFLLKACCAYTYRVGILRKAIVSWITSLRVHSPGVSPPRITRVIAVIPFLRMPPPGRSNESRFGPGPNSI
ncbi:hypothetical protein F4781DRAFT_279823 [Annulohypoxylon bovei var. microspora]|nr:hypothetical protein F4781DRAFT_279823 [Annulohypoxylon bovei var. microspora]